MWGGLLHAVSELSLPCVEFTRAKRQRLITNVSGHVLADDVGCEKGENAMNGERFRPPQPPVPGQPPQDQQGQPRPPQMGPPRIDSYYSSVAIVATSPREISVIFGRYVPTFGQGGEQGATPVFERQILMTVEQVEDLVRTLNQAVQDFKTRRSEMETRRPSGGSD